MNAIDETVQSMVAHGSDVLILLYEDYITWGIGDAIAEGSHLPSQML